MAIHPLAGQLAPASVLIDVPALEQAYYANRPDPADPRQRVAFGTSGHRGTSLDNTFTEAHILAITRAICDYRRAHGIDGPLFLGKDTHALSEPGPADGARGAGGRRRRDDPPARRRRDADAGHLARHPRLQPRPHRPQGRRHRDHPVAQPARRRRLQVQPAPRRAGRLGRHLAGSRTAPTPCFEPATPRSSAFRLPGRSGRARPARSISSDPTSTTWRTSSTWRRFARPGLKLGVDPLGGAAVHYWQPIADTYGLDITVTNPAVDPTFRFMTLDHDGQIRMDCSSPYAMASLVKLKDRFDLAFGNDPDSDRHGIVTKSMGLMNPNHYLAVAIRYLLTHRPDWPAHAKVGKTLVSSSLIDRVVNSLNRPLCEVPVGFKWFAPGLLDGSFCFGGEESAGASFLRRDGTVWTTDKDGPILDLLAAEILARTGKDPGEHYRELTAQFGTPYYTRIDAAGDPRAEGPAPEARSRRRQGIRPGRRADHGQADPRPGQQRADRRAQGRRRRAAGSPRGPPAPRTSTRSTPRASATRATWMPSSPKPSRSSPMP